MTRKFFVLALVVSVSVLVGCGGRFPTTLATSGPTPTPGAGVPTPTPTPRPGGLGALDLSNGAPIGTLYFKTNYGRSATDYKYQIYAMRSDGSGRVLIAESATGTGFAGLSFTGLSPDGKYIVYQANQNAYLAKADGSGRRTLAGGYAFDLTFTPDGQRLIYLVQSSTGSSRDVVVENLDGSGRRVVTTGTYATGTLGAFGLSAEGSKLVASGDTGLFVESIAGGGRVALAGTEFTVVHKPHFSPDGNKVAVYLQHKTDATRRGTYILNTDGTTNLTTAVPLNVLRVEAWTPLGLIHSAARTGSGITLVVEYEWFVVNPDGSAQRSLAKWAPTAFDNIGDIGRGVLSPDKAWLVYSSRNLFRVAIAGGAPQQLTNTATGSNFQPVFNNDGTRIMFLSNRDDRGDVPGGEGGGGRGTLYVMSADGSGQTRLIDGFSTDRPGAFRTQRIGGKTR